MPAASGCTMVNPESAACNFCANSLRCSRLNLPLCKRSKVDIFLFAMAYSFSFEFARLGSVGVYYTNSPAGSSLALSGQLATKQLIAATEVRLCDGHEGTKTLID